MRNQFCYDSAMVDGKRTFRLVLAALLLGPLIVGAGCVRRTISIDSDPPGALVWVNDREIGRTPVETDFLFYGTYDVRLVHPDAEPRLTTGKTRLPVWDMIPFDFAAEVMPVDFHSRTRWHYDLQPRDDDPAALLGRARDFRDRAADPKRADDPS